MHNKCELANSRKLLTVSTHSTKLFPIPKNFRETDKAKLSFKSCQNQHKTLEQFLPTATIDECAFVGGDNGIFSAVHWIQFEIDSPAAADERRN